MGIKEVKIGDITIGLRKKVNFDKTWFFRFQDITRVFLKKYLFTRLLKLRDRQSCRYCGRDQKIVWACEDEIWKKLSTRWHNKCLCLECFIELCPVQLGLSDIGIMYYIKD